MLRPSNQNTMAQIFYAVAMLKLSLSVVLYRQWAYIYLTQITCIGLRYLSVNCLYFDAIGVAGGIEFPSKWLDTNTLILISRHFPLT